MLCRRSRESVSELVDGARIVGSVNIQFCYCWGQGTCCPLEGDLMMHVREFCSLFLGLPVAMHA